MPDLHDAFEGLWHDLQSVDAPDLIHEAFRRAPSVDSPEPRAFEHAALRWLGAADLDTVDWIDADRAVLADLVDLLR